MIVGVAIRLKDGRVLSLPKPARHCHLSSEYNIVARADGCYVPKEKGWSKEVRRGGTQGFIDDAGVFYDRESALAHAIGCGQFSGSTARGASSQLYSEDLW